MIFAYSTCVLLAIIPITIGNVLTFYRLLRGNNPTLYLVSRGGGGWGAVYGSRAVPFKDAFFRKYGTMGKYRVYIFNKLGMYTELWVYILRK